MVLTITHWYRLLSVNRVNNLGNISDIWTTHITVALLNDSLIHLEIQSRLKSMYIQRHSITCLYFENAWLYEHIVSTELCCIYLHKYLLKFAFYLFPDRFYILAIFLLYFLYFPIFSFFNFFKC